MKFWKQTLLTALSFFGVATTVLYTACEKDSCTQLTCQNGGTCTSGFCNCPSGYEGAECETKSIDRYLGTYYGVTTCDTEPGIIDTVVVFQGSNLTTAGVVQFSHKTDTMYGSITTTPSDYSIVIADENGNNYKKTVTITLLDVNKLTLYTNITANGASSECTFRGAK